MGLTTREAIRPDEIARIKELLEAGRNLRQVAEAIGRPKSTVAYVAKSIGVGRTSKGKAKPPPAFGPVGEDPPVVPGPSDPEPIQAGNGDPLAEALKAARGGESPAADAEVVGKLGDFGAAPATGPAGSADDGRGLVDLLDGITGVVCRIYASTQRVPWTPKLQAAFKLTPAERSQLLILAPYAAPMVKQLIAYVPEIAAGLFGLSYVVMLSERMTLIKSARPAPPPPQKKEEKKKG